MNKAQAAALENIHHLVDCLAQRRQLPPEIAAVVGERLEPWLRAELDLLGVADVDPWPRRAARARDLPPAPAPDQAVELVPEAAPEPGPVDDQIDVNPDPGDAEEAA